MHSEYERPPDATTQKGGASAGPGLEEHNSIAQRALTTALATLLLPFPCFLRLLNQVLALVNGMVLDIGIVCLL